MTLQPVQENKSEKYVVTEGRLVFAMPYVSTIVLQNYLSNAKIIDQNTPILNWYYALPQKEQMLVSVSKL